MARPKKKIFFGLIGLLLLMVSNVGAISEEEVACGKDEFNDKETCEKCPRCEQGKGYPIGQDCGNGRGGNIICETCPVGTYRDCKDPSNRCKTCLDCEKYRLMEFKYHCRPDANAVCGGCLPGYEKQTFTLRSSEFIPLPCLKCDEWSTSEVCRNWTKQQKDKDLAETAAESKLSDEKQFTQVFIEKLEKDKEVAEAQVATLLVQNKNLTYKVASMQQDKNLTGIVENLNHNRKLIAEVQTLKEDKKILLIAVTVLSVLLGLLILVSGVFCLCAWRKKKWPYVPQRSRADSSDRWSDVENRIPDVSNSPLIKGTVVYSINRKLETHQQAESIREADPEHEAKEGDVVSQNASNHLPSSGGTPYGATPDTMLPSDLEVDEGDALHDSRSSCATTPDPFTAPNSAGYYSMPSTSAPSEASTALVQDLSDVHIGPFGRNTRCSTPLDSQIGNNHNVARNDLQQPFDVIPRARSCDMSDSNAIALHDLSDTPSYRNQDLHRRSLTPPATGTSRNNTHVMPSRQPRNAQRPAMQNFVQRPDGQETVAKTSACGGARPKQQRNIAVESEAQANDRRRYEAALNVCAGRVVSMEESERQKLGLKLTPANPPIQGAPHFFIAAEQLKVSRDVYKSWVNGSTLVDWMCGQHTHLRDLLLILNGVRMMEARDYLVDVVLERSQEDRGLGGHERDQPGDGYRDEPYAEDGPGSRRQPFNCFQDHPSNCGIAQDSGRIETFGNRVMDGPNGPLRDVPNGYGESGSDTSQSDNAGEELANAGGEAPNALGDHDNAPDQSPNSGDEARNANDEFRGNLQVPLVVDIPPESDDEAEDDIQGASGPHEQESKGDALFGISETNRSSQPLTPPANQDVLPFRVR